MSTAHSTERGSRSHSLVAGIAAGFVQAEDNIHVEVLLVAKGDTSG